MYYFVIGADGRRYGPADIDTLVAWVQEGRIVAATSLVERGTDRQLSADSLPALAAAIRRGAAGPVVVERAGGGEAPTMTQPGPAGRRAGGSPPVPGQAQFPPMPYAGRIRPLGNKNKVVAGLLGIFLGGFGVHRFYLGYTGIGILQIVLTVASCGIASLWGFVEGIICLCGGMTDADGYELRD